MLAADQRIVPLPQVEANTSLDLKPMRAASGRGVGFRRPNSIRLVLLPLATRGDAALASTETKQQNAKDALMKERIILAAAASRNDSNGIAHVTCLTGWIEHADLN